MPHDVCSLSVIAAIAIVFLAILGVRLLRRR